jgi:hypothetical protein
MCAGCFASNAQPRQTFTPGLDHQTASTWKLTDLACAAGCLAVIVREAYLSAAEYVGASCRYTEVYGVDTNLNLGGGAQEFTFRRSAQVRALTACQNQAKYKWRQHGR